MYEYGRYRGSVVAALVLLGVCVLFGSRRSHGADAPPIRHERPATGAPEVRVDVSKIEPAPISPVSKDERTLLKIQRYASEGFPAWARAHTGKECPASIDELNKYIGAGDSLDAWGHPMYLLCGPPLPRGWFEPMSAGEDGIAGTADDFTCF